MLAAIRKVLITDDHSLVRAGIAHLVSRLLPQAEVLHAETRLGTLQALNAHPDIGLLVVDLTLTDAHGLGIIESVFAHHPLLPVVVVSGVEDADLARRAVALGVLGFVAKSADSAATEAALQTVLNGGRYLPSFAYAVPQQKSFSPSNLSERQAEVMRLMCEGLSNKQIATALGLTEATVKGHLTLVFRALKVSSRSQAILAAQVLPR
jgi:DNA-binding NarL/FixJ family response regulator